MTDEISSPDDYTCKSCGQVFDRRYLGQVLHHETRGHEMMTKQQIADACGGPIGVCVKGPSPNWELLNKIQAIADQTESGPWFVDKITDSGLSHIAREARREELPHINAYVEDGRASGLFAIAVAETRDAEFIVMSRENIPKLVEMVRERDILLWEVVEYLTALFDNEGFDGASVLIQFPCDCGTDDCWTCWGQKILKKLKVYE